MNMLIALCFHKRFAKRYYFSQSSIGGINTNIVILNTEFDIAV